MSVEIRRAILDDLEAVARLFGLYRVFYKKIGDAAKELEFVRQRMATRESVIFVAAETKGELVGFVQLYPSFSSLSMASVWILNDLYVVEARRRSGLARRLIEAAHDFARSSGAVSIQLETATDNLKAQALYESFGYHAEKDFMTYSLSMARNSSR
jgi:ribosomal protein S18 acetylase RimI-like enzyme